MVGVYLLKKANNRVYKILNRDNEVGDKLYCRLKKSKQQKIFKHLIENMWKHYILGQHLVQGKCLGLKGDYQSPFIEGPILGNLDSLSYLPTSIIVAIILAIQILLVNLKK